MFKEPTVLVLGAGASHPYDYPVGGALIDRILDLCVKNSGHYRTNDDFFREVMTIAKVKEAALFECREALWQAMPASIDYFLSKNEKYMAVGKLAIAYRIMQCENPNSLFTRNPEKLSRMWYHKLVNLILHDIRDLDVSKLAIVTFNYDRSLDEFLFRAIKNRFGLEDQDAAAAVAKIPVHHVYGTLGSLPHSGRPNSRIYGDINEPGLVVEAAKDIHIISQLACGSESLQSICSLVKEAANVFLVGFGFHRENCEKIGLVDNSSTESKVVVSSSRGILPPQKAEIEKRLGVTFLDERFDASGFMDNSADFVAAGSG